MSLDLGHWKTDLMIEELPYGFIYEIINSNNQMKYIGKKQCMAVKKRPPLKGKRNKRHYVVETDWKNYTSSCNELNQDIEKHGKDNFVFKIIRLCNSKSEMAYWEAKIQFERDVLLKEDYYNGIINLRVSRIKSK